MIERLLFNLYYYPFIINASIKVFKRKQKLRKYHKRYLGVIIRSLPFSLLFLCVAYPYYWKVCSGLRQKASQEPLKHKRRFQL